MTIITPAAIATLARVSSNTVLRAINSGELPAAKHGRNYIVAQDDAQQWINGRNLTARREALRAAIERIRAK